MDIRKTEAVLKDLNDTRVVRVTGSFADGTETRGSDIDIQILADRYDIYGQRKTHNYQKIFDVLKKHGLKYTNKEIGIHVTTADNPDLCYTLDINNSFQFDHRKNRMKEVEICGVRLKTW